MLDGSKLINLNRGAYAQVAPFVQSAVNAFGNRRMLTEMDLLNLTNSVVNNGRFLSSNRIPGFTNAEIRQLIRNMILLTMQVNFGTSSVNPFLQRYYGEILGFLLSFM
ncbi:hypothetical protein, partial [Treponema sp. R6D11]